MTLIKKLRLQSSSIRQAIEKADHAELSHYLTDFFNQSEKDFVLKNKRQDKRSKLTFLLCLDNCEDLLSSKKPEYKEF